MGTSADIPAAALTKLMKMQIIRAVFFIIYSRKKYSAIAYPRFEGHHHAETLQMV
jgi:hypothetical protein